MPSSQIRSSGNGPKHGRLRSTASVRTDAMAREEFRVSRELRGWRNRLVTAAVVMAAVGAGGLVASVATPSTASAAVTNYSCVAGPDGTNQTFTVPANVSAVTVTVSGAQGGAGQTDGDPGGA